MKLRSSKVACYLGTALVLMLSPVIPVVADAQTTYEQHESTITDTEFKEASYTANVSDIVSAGYEEDGTFSSKALSIGEPYIEVLSVGSEEAEVVGRLYKNTLVDVLEVGSSYTNISSGNVSGYVSTAYLCFNEEAEVIAEQIDYEFNTGYTIAEAEQKEADEEAARVAAEEEARKAEEERKAAEEREAAKRRQIIENTVSGTDFTYNPTMSVSEDDIWLLACVIDWEAGWESYEGKLAVANVVLNRVRSSYYPNTVSGVIYQRSQFSGVSDGNGNASSTFSNRIANGPRTQECMQAALEALSGKNNIGGYTAFRATWVFNFDAYSDYMIIGNHVFH